MNITELQEACQILGLNYEEFVETPELEKGVPDYKSLYEQQKALNEKILGNISEISKSFDSRLGEFKSSLGEDWKGQISELQKSISAVQQEVNDMKQNPANKPKSVTSVHAIEKAVGQTAFKDAVQTFDLKNPLSVKELKKCLAGKAVEELQKGVQNGCYERAALELDANHTIPVQLIKAIYDKDKIYIQA